MHYKSPQPSMFCFYLSLMLCQQHHIFESWRCTRKIKSDFWSEQDPDVAIS